MPLYSMSTRPAPLFFAFSSRTSGVRSAWESMVSTVTPPKANSSGRYSTSPSSQISSRVFSPLSNLGSFMVSWMKVVLPLSSWPRNR